MTAISDVRELLAGLGPGPRAATLRHRADLLERAAALVELRPASRDDVVRLAKLMLDLRDEATVARGRRALHEAIASMMD